jgi:hypothetical protein
MTRRKLAMFLTCVCVPACGAAPDGQDTGHLGSPDNDKAPTLVEKANFFTVALTDQQWTVLAPTSTHLCFVSQFSGNFEDGASPVLNAPIEGGVAVLTNSGWWLGAGHNSQATCVAWSNFSSPQANAGPLFTDPQLGGVLSGSNSSGSTNIGIWAGDAFSFIAGVDGTLEGGGEQVNVVQSASTTGASILNLQTQDGDDNAEADLIAWTVSALIVPPNLPVGSRHLVNLAGTSTNPDCGSNGTCDIIGNMTTVGTFEWNAVAKSNKTVTRFMVPTSMGFCAFTQISGDFDGGGEKVSITAQSGRWVLTASAQGGSAYAKARCMAYSQP